MIEKLQAAGIDVILPGVPEKGLLPGSPDFFGDLANRYGIPCDDEVIPCILSRNSLKSDYVHANAADYAMLAEAVWKLVCESQRQAARGRRRPCRGGRRSPLPARARISG